MNQREDEIRVNNHHPGKRCAQFHSCEYDFVQDVAGEADAFVGWFDCLEKPDIKFPEERCALEVIRDSLDGLPFSLFLDCFNCPDRVNGQ
jgi:hypothetical protein